MSTRQQTTTTPQAVVIVGPNLPSSLAKLGSFHVHAAGCADLKRGTIRPYAARIAPETFASKTEICDGIYPPSDFDCESGEYMMEFHFAPCVKLGA